MKWLKLTWIDKISISSFILKEEYINTTILSQKISLNKKCVIFKSMSIFKFIYLFETNCKLKNWLSSPYGGDLLNLICWKYLQTNHLQGENIIILLKFAEVHTLEIERDEVLIQ